MEQQSSTSKVTVEYFDPHDVYKLLAPGLVPRLPLRNLHWQSHSGPLRSIDTLHVELVRGGEDAAGTAAPRPPLSRSASAARDDGFQTQNIGGRADPTDTVDTGPLPSKTGGGGQRRHQIPGLRRTPYLKVLLVRCDDNDSYKSSVRSEVREWIKTQTPPSSSSKKNNSNNQEKHDAFEWLIVHVVIPNTTAATQPRSGTISRSDTGASEKTTTSSRWRTGSTPVMEKLRSDFNTSGKGAIDRVLQIRIGINDVPYDLLPRVVPAVPSGYSETEQDAERAWDDLINKFKSQILTSFDKRVTQYEDDIKEKDAQRSLPGWNFCTFFILKEGLARGFENVGLVDDALVGYDELSVGLDAVIQEQAEMGAPERHGGAMLGYTEELKAVAERAMASISGNDGEEEAVDLQSKAAAEDEPEDICISSIKKAYRDMILENKVSIFDFRCYIFSRQIALLLRLGNAIQTREKLLEKIKEQQDSILHGVAPLAAPAPKPESQVENLDMLAEVCRRTLQFIPSISQVMRRDIEAGLTDGRTPTEGQSVSRLQRHEAEILDNIVVSFAFSVAQQTLAQTTTKALPIPPSTLMPGEGQEPKSSIPEPKTMMHPARSSSLHITPSQRPPASPGIFPGPGRRASVAEGDVQSAQFLKAGLEELAARRADLYMLSRSVLQNLGKKRGWGNGWDIAPMVGDADEEEMEDVSLDDDAPSTTPAGQETQGAASVAGIDSLLLRTATDNTDDFYRLYEILTDKALRHYTVANYDHAYHANMADLAVLKMKMKQYRAAAAFFSQTTYFFGISSWTTLELSMLVMYTRCLTELQSDDDYVRVALTLITKACSAERERRRQKAALGLGNAKQKIPELSALKGVLGKLLTLTASLPTEANVPLLNFFTDVEIDGPPHYLDGRDSCSIAVKLWSLLPEETSIDKMALKATTTDGSALREILFEQSQKSTLMPGKNVIHLTCNSLVPAKYEATHLKLTAGKLHLTYQKDDHNAEGIKHPNITIYQRGDALDVQLKATKHVVLDKDNSLDLALSTGWNALKSCEIRVRPATGGLRIQTREAKFVDSEMDFSKPPEAGVFTLGAVEENTTVTLRFPYSLEQDLGDVSMKIEVTYVTHDDESFFLAKSTTVSVALAIGVNVQDVFKHQALFSRFNVSTATPGPLRLYKSELLGSDLFQPTFGVPPSSPITVFPKQAASLMYKVQRKQGSRAGGGKAAAGGKTMYLKLHYSLLQSEVEDAIAAAAVAAVGEREAWRPYSRLVRAAVLAELRSGLQAHDLERAALQGAAETAVLARVVWERYFVGVGRRRGGARAAATAAQKGEEEEEEDEEDVETGLSAYLRQWQEKHPRVRLPATSSATAAEPSTILIPVEVPSLSVVHTADMRLHLDPDPSAAADPLSSSSYSSSLISVNQMIPATLHLKWTRIWDTDHTSSSSSSSSGRQDIEFSYEVSAASDTWLVGGRRKGHFVIPKATPAGHLSSTPDVEGEIPLILIPQREGWLPYPTVEIKPVLAAGNTNDDSAAAAVGKDGSSSGSRVPEVAVAAPSSAVPTCEVDWRNLGETVRVVGDRASVTVSLDASGGGGGPLVLGSEATAVINAGDGRRNRIVA